MQNADIVATGDTLTAPDGEEFTLIVAGDLTNDGKVDVSDIMQLKSIIMSDKSTAIQLLAGDLDASGDLTVSDILGLKNLIMKGA